MFVSTFISIVSAQTKEVIQTGKGVKDADDVATIGGFDNLFNNIIIVVLQIAAVVLFIMIIVGGFKYITSGGNPKLAESAKHTLTYAILGMILVAAAFLVLQFIETFTGAPVTNFSVRVP